ncbi:hypothetical protein [Methanosarcina mazei]|jgi:hypothetical protein|uniref:Uncharacterized protein n=1 Tax=Methanosarcina mazei TaxID=2209 RepID=A0A0F8SYK3_METMZ|nr:hypothetical protein [Methanosarcina mazei]KKG07223.1 hypothetical protein DU31_06130 [Methanosarcina mazei]KKG34077.1 hypothetical protein DU52_10565 [Methanosarcina mazei]KKG35953.1 hypothetical protein DU30_13920 [Methanosarcina mazei]KKG57997.1 hypothetical protein DU33_15690 [Methanosarcina mazei]KKG62275.1 hypothetical protein DU45_12260 [Methanosarcina mazei]
MNKLLIIITGLLLLGIIGISGCVSEEEAPSAPEATLEYTPEEFKARQNEIARAVQTTIDDRNYRSAKQTGLTINYNLGLEDGSFVVLVYFDFTAKNTRNTANEMMKMYSDDLVASLANQGITDISEAAIFWKDDYNNRNVKYAYEYKNNGFFVSDIAGE